MADDDYEEDRTRIALAFVVSGLQIWSGENSLIVSKICLPSSGTTFELCVSTLALSSFLGLPAVKLFSKLKRYFFGETFNIFYAVVNCEEPLWFVCARKSENNKELLDGAEKSELRELKIKKIGTAIYVINFFVFPQEYLNAYSVLRCDSLWPVVWTKIQRSV